MMFEQRSAYRHRNGDVEGFLGIGSTKAEAVRNSLSQIYKKLAMMGDECDPTRLIDKPDDLAHANLTPSEVAQIVADWGSGYRY